MTRAASCLLLIGLLGAAAGTSAAAQELTGTLKKVKDGGTITLGFREDALPFSYRRDASPARPEPCEEAAPRRDIQVGRACAVGYAIDLCREIVDDVSAELDGMPIRVRFRPVTPENRIPRLRAGDIDLECGSTTSTAERRREVAFSPPFFVTGTRLLVRKADGIRSYRDLKGRTLVVTQGTSNEAVLRQLDTLQNLNLDFVTAPDHAASFSLFSARQADAFATDDILLYGFIARNRAAAELAVVGDMLSYEPYGIMHRKDDPLMAALVERTFARLATTRTIVRLYERWFLQSLPDGERLNRPMTPQLLAIFRSLGLPD
jgi:ABC-type amino acid transport substrate-binding protein